MRGVPVQTMPQPAPRQQMREHGVSTQEVSVQEEPSRLTRGRHSQSAQLLRLNTMHTHVRQKHERNLQEYRDRLASGRAGEGTLDGGVVDPAFVRRRSNDSRRLATRSRLKANATQGEFRALYNSAADFYTRDANAWQEMVQRDGHRVRNMDHFHLDFPGIPGRRAPSEAQRREMQRVLDRAQKGLNNAEIAALNKPRNAPERRKVASARKRLETVQRIGAGMPTQVPHHMGSRITEDQRLDHGYLAKQARKRSLRYFGNVPNTSDEVEKFILRHAAAERKAEAEYHTNEQHRREHGTRGDGDVLPEMQRVPIRSAGTREAEAPPQAGQRGLARLLPQRRARERDTPSTRVQSQVSLSTAHRQRIERARSEGNPFRLFRLRNFEVSRRGRQDRDRAQQRRAPSAVYEERAQNVHVPTDTQLVLQQPQRRDHAVHETQGQEMRHGPTPRSSHSLDSHAEQAHEPPLAVTRQHFLTRALSANQHPAPYQPPHFPLCPRNQDRVFKHFMQLQPPPVVSREDFATAARRPRPGENYRPPFPPSPRQLQRAIDHHRSEYHRLLADQQRWRDQEREVAAVGQQLHQHETYAAVDDHFQARQRAIEAARGQPIQEQGAHEKVKAEDLERQRQRQPVEGTPLHQRQQEAQDAADARHREYEHESEWSDTMLDSIWMPHAEWPESSRSEEGEAAAHWHRDAVDLF